MDTVTAALSSIVLPWLIDSGNVFGFFVFFWIPLLLLLLLFTADNEGKRGG